MRASLCAQTTSQESADIQQPAQRRKVVIELQSGVIELKVQVVLWVYRDGYLCLVEDGELDSGIADQLYAEAQGWA